METIQDIRNRFKEVCFILKDDLYNTPEYIEWLELQIIEKESYNTNRIFEISYKYLNSTDDSLHIDNVIAEDYEEALRIFYFKYKFSAEYSTIKKIN